MRIVGGAWRGRELRAPEGRDTRPTTDRNRESFASMVLSAFGLDISELSALDAFAGSGALGLELLSRGAAHVTFVDSARPAVACVRANLRALGAERQANVVQGDIERVASQGRPLPGAPFGLLVFDPPYALSADRVAAVVGGLYRSGQLADGCVITYERTAKAPSLDLEAQGIEGVRARKPNKHGITATDLLYLP